MYILRPDEVGGAESEGALQEATDRLDCGRALWTLVDPLSIEWRGVAEGIVRTARRARWTAVDLLSLELGGLQPTLVVEKLRKKTRGDVGPIESKIKT